MFFRLTALLFCVFSASFLFSEEEELSENLFLSTPDQIAALLCEPSSLVGGVISPLSGQPVLRQTDLTVRGAQNVLLTRTYVPIYAPCFFPKHKSMQKEYDKKFLYFQLRDNYRGWEFYPHLKLHLNTHTMRVRFADPNGVVLEFQLSGPNYSIATFASSSYGINNLGADVPSGKCDPRNTRISYEKSAQRITVYTPDGTTRYYEMRASRNYIPRFYLLIKEVLPSGKVLKYGYNDRGTLNSIVSMDPHERYSYATLNITGTPQEGICNFTSSSGLSAQYTYERRSLKWKISEKKHKGEKLKEKRHHRCPPILTSVSSPDYRNESSQYCDRFLLGYHSGKNDLFRAYYQGFKDKDFHFRVERLQFPVGANGMFSTVHELSYQPPVAGEREGITHVRNSDGTSQVYHFSRNLLTTAIQYFAEDGILKKEKQFFWTENNWLNAVEMRDGDRNLLYRKRFEYDRFGNPILETFIGDLTGEQTQETFTTTRSFSEDGRNLLLREECDDGKNVSFTYLPGTNLRTSKLIRERDRIILREFYVYDDCNNLIQEIFDDGSSEEKDNVLGITQRTLTSYSLRQSAPFLHMPEWIVETYLEDNSEKLLRKRHLVYDSHGNIAEEAVYGSEGEHAYTIFKTYNERGDVLTETNRIQQEAIYTYDANGRLETSSNFSKRIQKTFHRDTKGRPLTLTEKGDEGVIHVTSSEYDFHDRMTLKKDPFGNTTYYTYDYLVAKPIRTDFPSIASFNGMLTPVVTLSSYDPFGREQTQTDPNGNITHYRYNAFGSPAEILHPNGGIEHYRYAKNGKLCSHTNSDGLTILYTNDVLGRVLSKTYLSRERKCLAKEVFTYSGFNLLTETDKEGNVRIYSYDGAGRKIRETFCGQVTEFDYDSLGRLSLICKHNGFNTLFTHYTRDLEDRIVEEKKVDSYGGVLSVISYAYDADGNQKSTTRYINGKEATDTYHYDSFCRPIEHIDSEGQSRKVSYNENWIDSLNQKVLQTTTTDPRQIATIETQDALKRIVRTEILNPEGATLSLKEMIHDPQGNLLQQTDHIYQKGRYYSSQTLRYTYTPDHRPASLTRAFGTANSRTTAYSYTPSGKIAIKTLPDGVILTYCYHPLGSLAQLDSSDDKMRHVFEYDRLGHLKSASDANQNLEIQRVVDPFGNVTKETFPSGLQLEKEFDAFNRILSLKIKDHGEFTYTYDPLFLRQVRRISPLGKVLYEHSYEEYDNDGNLQLESVIGGLGSISHSTNSKRAKTSIISPYFTQECQYDSVGNLVSNTIDGTTNHYSYDGLSQLSEENTTTYASDSLYNRTQKDAQSYTINDLNELLSYASTHYSHDRNGNLSTKTTPSGSSYFTYDPLNRLTEVHSNDQKVQFIYDPLGRRLSKIVYERTSLGFKETLNENYLYQDQDEIGAFDSHNQLKNLRALAPHKQMVSLELNGQIFAPIIDVQGNVRRLINLKSRKLTNSYDFTAFGEILSQSSNEQPSNPWQFASKRYDPELALIYFGKRYYDPELARWLSIDPAGFTDSTNLYQYVFNNPFRYHDPDGQFIIALPLLAMTWKVVAVAAAAAYVGYQLEHQHRHSNSEFSRSVNSALHQVVQSVGGVSQYLLNQKLEMAKKKQIDARLPNSPDELLNDPSWEETSHPGAKEGGHRTFENKKTGEKLRHDGAKPNATGHKGESHWHRLNPNSISRFDEYLDAKDHPVPKNSPESHLYPLN